MSQKQQLRQLLSATDHKFSSQQKSWLTRYNQVIQTIKTHNTYDISACTLKQLHCYSKLYLFTSKIISNYGFSVLLIIVLLFLPIINIIAQALLVSYMLYLIKQMKTHDFNLRRTGTTFQHFYFYFYPEMCAQLGKHFTTLNLSVKEVDNFIYNQNNLAIRINLAKLKIQAQGTQLIKIPIYDQYFYDSYYLVTRQLYKSIIWTVYGVISIVLSVILCISLFDFD